MIHHISISASEPQRVAGVITELWQTVALPFPPLPGAFIVIAEDGHGSAIEVSPLGTELAPGEGDQEVQARLNETASPFTATHAALSVPISEAQIKEVAAREGWRAETFDRGPAFRLVELWVENRLLIELLPPEMAQRYLDFMTPRNFAERFQLELPGAQN
ncbi:MAG TPA: hypothetical protein VKA60_23980 [Blastocatellia bacterium]|nr:hypothetical protein [Blastocatellia bacterium]